MILLILQLLKSLYKYYKQEYYSIFIILQCSKKMNGWLTVTLNHNITFFFKICKLQFFLILRERKYAKIFSSQYIFCFLSLDTYYCKYLYKYFDWFSKICDPTHLKKINPGPLFSFFIYTCTNILKLFKIAGHLWYPVIHHFMILYYSCINYIYRNHTLHVLIAITIMFIKIPRKFIINK